MRSHCRHCGRQVCADARTKAVAPSRCRTRSDLGESASGPDCRRGLIATIAASPTQAPLNSYNANHSRHRGQTTDRYRATRNPRATRYRRPNVCQSGNTRLAPHFKPNPRRAVLACARFRGTPTPLQAEPECLDCLPCGIVHHSTTPVSAFRHGYISEVHAIEASPTEAGTREVRPRQISARQDRV